MRGKAGTGRLFNVEGEQLKPPFDHRIKRPFKYVPASGTNVAKTIERARKAIEAAERPATDNVRPLAKKIRQAA